MAMPRRPSEGENVRGFESITPNGRARDPSEPRRKPSGMGYPAAIPSSRDDDGRWGQFSPGREDDQGADHDW